MLISPQIWITRPKAQGGAHLKTKAVKQLQMVRPIPALQVLSYLDSAYSASQTSKTGAAINSCRRIVTLFMQYCVTAAWGCAGVLAQLQRVAGELASRSVAPAIQPEMAQDIVATESHAAEGASVVGAEAVTNAAVAAASLTAPESREKAAESKAVSKKGEKGASEPDGNSEGPS